MQKCARFLRFGGLVLATFALALFLAHAALVRRFVLGWVTKRLTSAVGFPVRAQALEYNLCQGWFQVHAVSAGVDNARPLLSVKLLTVRVPVTDLFRGEFGRARIAADEVGLRLDRKPDGNWDLAPPPGKPKDSRTPTGLFASLHIGTLSLTVADKSAGVTLDLPYGGLDASWQASQYRLAYRTLGKGRFQSVDYSAPLDRVIVDAKVTADALVLQDSSVYSGNSAITVDRARLGFAGADLAAAGSATIDAAQFFRNTSGRASASFILSGNASSPSASLRVTSDAVKNGDFQLQKIALAARYHDGTVEIADAYGLTFGARVHLRGLMDARRSPVSTHASMEIDGFRIASLPAKARLEATCAGTDWRNSRLSGVLRIANDAQVAFQGRLEGDQLALSLDANSSAGIGAQGATQIGITNRSLSGELRGRIESVGRAIEVVRIPAPVPLNGSLDWRLKLGGNLSHPAVAFTAGSTDLSLPAVTTASLALAGAYDSSGIRLDSLRLRSGAQEISASGTVGPDMSLQIGGVLKDLSVGSLLDAAAGFRGAGGSASGNFTLRGTPSQPQINARVGVSGLQAYGQQLGRLDARVDFHDDTLSVERLQLRQPEGGVTGEVEASGAVDFTTHRFQFSAKGADLHVEQSALRGAVSVTAEGNGSFDHPEVKLVAEASQVVTGTFPIGGLNAEVKYDGAQATAVLTAPELNASAHVEVQASGGYPATFEIVSTGTQASSFRYSDRTFSGALEGTVSGSAQLGTPELQTASLKLRNLEIEVEGYKVQSDGAIEADYRQGRLNISPISLTAPSTRIQIAGELPVDAAQPEGRLSVAGTVQLDEALKSLGVEGGGEVKLDAAIVGSLGKWQPSLKLTLANGRLSAASAPVAVEQVTAEAHVADGVLRVEKLQGKLAGGDLRASATAPLHLLAAQFDPPAENPSQPIRWSVETERIHLQRSAQEDAGVTFNLRAAGEAARLSLADVKSTVELSDLSVHAERADLKQAQPARITIDSSAAQLEPLELRGTDSTLRISGRSTISANPAMDIQVTGETDASVLALVGKNLEAAGQVTLDLRLKGSLQNPAGSGSVSLNHASLTLRDMPVRAEEVTGRLDLVDNRLVLRSLTGMLNGGKFSGDGQAGLRDGKPTDVAVRLEAENVFLNYPTGLESNNNLHLLLRSDERGLILGGQVDVREGIFRAALDPRLNNTAISAVPGGSKLTSNPIALDIAVATSQPVEMDNNIGRLAAAGSLRVRGDVDNPILSGEIRLEEGGRLYFGDRRYDLERGSIRLDPANPSDPQVNLLAITNVSSFEIRLALSGTARNLTTTFTSDPPLSRNDIISVLLSGKTVAENRGVDIRKLEAYSLLSGALNATVGGSMGRKLGISQVSVQPSMIAAESDAQTRLSITEDFTRALRLVYSMNLSDSGDQIWVVEYDLTRRLHTRAVKESDNSYRAEVRHEIRFGGVGTTGTLGSPTVKRKIGQVRFVGGDPFGERELARQFGIKPEQIYRPITVRAAAERLQGFFQQQGYLESRVHLNRDEGGDLVALTAEINLGPQVSLRFTGDSVPRQLQKRIRQVWQNGYTDKQRSEAASQVLQGHFGQAGFLHAATVSRIDVSAAGHKSVAFDLQRGRRYSGVHLALDGVSRQHAQEILALIRTAQLEEAVYSEPRRVSDAIVRYYQQRGYLAAEVGLPRPVIDEQAATGRIVISVTEGPAFRVGEVEFTGNRALAKEALLANLQLDAGAQFEPARLSAAVTTLRRKYESQGYLDVVIDYGLKQDAAKGVLDVSFHIQEKDQRIVQSVRIEGNRQTSDKFVRSQLTVSEGQPEAVSQESQSIQNLSRTGAFATVDIESHPSGGDSLPNANGADLLVKVREAQPFRVLYGGLYSTSSGVGFIADVENRNSLGSARIVGLRTRYDGDLQEVRLYLTQPVWGRLPLSTTFATYGTRQTIAEGVQQTKLGASLQQDWPFRPMYLFSYGYRYEQVRLKEQLADTRSLPPDQVVTAPVYFTGSRDSRDSFLDATHGSFATLGLEYAPGWLGSEYGYIRWTGQFSKYFPLMKPAPVPFGEEPRKSRLVFATQIRMGLESALNPEGLVLTDRFFTGGGTTIRGYPQDGVGPQTASGEPLGGSAMIVLNNELRFPLFKFFDGVAFVDMGNVYPTISDFRLSELRKSAGFGLRVRNPFVILRFDFGAKIGRRPGESFGGFFFSIGQAF